MDAPFAYRVIRERHGHVGVFRRLREAVAAARPWEPEEVGIYACSDAGRELSISPDWYSRPNPPSREEALELIHRRQTRINEAIAEGTDPAIWRAMGCLRCSCNDPEEKQIADYIATAPWVWLAPEEVRDEP